MQNNHLLCQWTCGMLNTFAHIFNKINNWSTDILLISQHNLTDLSFIKYLQKKKNQKSETNSKENFIK